MHGLLTMSAAAPTMNVLCPGCILHSPRVIHVHLLPRASIDSSTTVISTLLLPNASIRKADSHVSGGEVHGTLLGPNANSHHQSLLIGVLWPLGRGNVGYGSNVGSNHTGRIPDQETSVGEGTFWGLGCVIKFPVNLTCAPYSIVAAGVQLPPQRIMFPFSLITIFDFHNVL